MLPLTPPLARIATALLVFCMSLAGGPPASARPAPQAAPPLQISEVEPNDGPAGAQFVGGGNAIVNGAVNPAHGGCAWLSNDDAEDWYKVTLTSAVTLGLSLTGSGPSNADLTLFDADAGCDFDSNLGFAHGPTNADQLSMALQPGDYYIAVTAYDPVAAVGNVIYTLTISGGSNPQGGPTDLALALVNPPKLATRQNEHALALTITNAGPNVATGTLTAATPQGTTLAALTLSQGHSTGVAPGHSGTISATTGPIAPDGSVQVEVRLNVGADAPEQLTVVFEVAADVADTEPNNNAASASASVLRGQAGLLAFAAPAGNPLDPPRDLQLQLLGREAGEGAPGADATVPLGSQVTCYRIYRANSPNLQPSAGNLFGTLPPSQTTAMVEVAPGGTWYVVTACYDDGESAPSNEAGATVPGPTLTSLKLSKKKLTANGSGFSPGVRVFVDGIPFAAPPAVKRNATRVIQKGALESGESLAALFASGRQLVFAFRNEDAGLTTVVYEP